MVKTREITAKNYGVIVRKGSHRHFVSPATYALSIIALETPMQIRNRLQEYAIQRGPSFEELVKDVTAGVVQKHGSKNLLNVHSKETVSRVHRFGSRITAEVKSRSRGSRNVLIGTTQAHITCPCPEMFWDKVKNYDFGCAHLATLETAITIDNISANRIEDTITGLSPKDRPEIILPFTFLQGEGGVQKVTQVLIDRYIGNKSFTEINKELLKDPALYDPGLLQLIQSGDVIYRVLRGKERDVKIDSKHERYYGSVRNLVDTLSGFIREQIGLRQSGYSLEFRGSEHEVVARRFYGRGRSMSICTKDGKPPIVVERFVGDKKAHWLTSPNDTCANSPYNGVGQLYESIDDVSRTTGPTKVLIPGLSEPLHDIPVSQLMQRAYRSVLNE